MVVVVEEVGGTAPGLPGPEVAFEVGWSSSSSEEPPVYATKPVFSLFTAGAKTGRREQKKKQEKRERESERKAAHVERRKTEKIHNNSSSSFQVKGNYFKHMLGETKS